MNQTLQNIVTRNSQKTLKQTGQNDMTNMYVSKKNMQILSYVQLFFIAIIPKDGSSSTGIWQYVKKNTE